MTSRFGRIGSMMAVWLVASSAYTQEVSPPSAKDSVQFLAIGDTGTGDSAQYQVAAQVAKAHAVFPFTFAIMMGDNMYGTERTKDYEKKFETPYKPLLDAKVEFYAALGNHDDPNQKLYKPFNMNGERFYTFKKGNVRFFALDSNYFDQTQADWLEKALAESRRTGRSASSITRCTPRALVMDPRWTCARSSSRCS